MVHTVPDRQALLRCCCRGVSRRAAQVSSGPPGPANALEGYRRLRLQLGECLVALSGIAQHRTDPREAQIRDLAARLAEDRLILAVVGQFSRGKSTLMNAILSSAYLPSGALPTTAVLTTITYGSTMRALVRKGNGPFPVETAIENLRAYVTAAGDTGAGPAVTSVDVEIPAEILRLGVAFVDTPGVGSSIASNTETTMGFIPKADAVIFVSSCDAPLTQAEVDLMMHLREHAKQIFVVLNKRDLLHPSEVGAVKEFARSTVARAGLQDAPIYDLSALEGLEAKVRDDRDAVQASGLATLEQDLIAYLTSDKTRDFLLGVCQRAQRLTGGVLGDTRAAVAAKADSERADALLRRLETEQESCRQRLVQELGASVRESLSATGAVLHERWGAVPRGVAPRGAGSSDDERVSEALQGCSQEVEASLEAGAKAILEALRELPGLLRDGARADFPHLTAAEAAEGKAGDPPPLAIDVGGLECLRAAQPTRRWRVGRGSSGRAGEEGPLEALLSAADAAVERWLAEVDDWSRSRLSMAAKDLRTSIFQPSEPFLLEGLSFVERTLGEVRERLEDGHSSLVGPEPVIDREGARAQLEQIDNGCVVCTRLLGELFRFMAHYQLELNASMQLQRRHSVHGFCPLHTWYYEALVVPVTVSGSYAGVAEARSRDLAQAVMDATDLATLAAAVESLVPSGRYCPACEVLSRAENETIHEWVQRSRDPVHRELPSLCIAHLGRLVVGGTSLEVARALVVEAAERFRRQAEDMREFALKNSSLRARLVHAEERTAYRQVLVGLVGEQLLAGAPVAGERSL